MFIAKDPKCPPLWTPVDCSTGNSRKFLPQESQQPLQLAKTSHRFYHQQPSHLCLYKPQMPKPPLHCPHCWSCPSLCDGWCTGSRPGQSLYTPTNVSPTTTRPSTTITCAPWSHSSHHQP
ncbi:hypothetical protein P7K49_009069 [Saguinus oedipus]|uniref:Uncharacterized protein n=1 Tax=Saguinus oedipus TaxID=9490 RepID=A0ABQ9W1Z2_SAGOE|nr:hypothetical protein P7K49_009069 [Saguinus oedipus]